MSFTKKPSESAFEAGAIGHPFYMPAGGFRTADPDGYVLRIGQLDATAG